MGRRVMRGNLSLKKKYKKTWVWVREKYSTWNSSDQPVSSLTYHSGLQMYRAPKETYLRTIYNIIHPCLDRIWEDSSLDRNDQGV